MIVDDLLPRCGFAPNGERTPLAVSGGPDSLALLALAVAAGCCGTVHHGHHGVRADADSDADLVVERCRALGVDVVVHRLALEPGPNFEERARNARRGAFPRGVATGHTLDDQAETVVLALLRGSGPRGLRGMRFGPTHPLLRLRRADTHRLCRQLGWRVADDASNDDPSFARNRVRHEVLPLLCDVAGRDVAVLLARTADSAADVVDVLDEVASSVDPLAAGALRAAPAAVSEAAIQRCWTATTGLPPLDHRAVGRWREVATGSTPRHDLAAGWSVARTAGTLRLVAPSV